MISIDSGIPNEGSAILQLYSSPTSLGLTIAMTKIAVEETIPSLDNRRSRPDFVGYCRAQVEELLTQEENIPHHKHKSSTEIIGAGLSHIKNEKLNALLRQCVLDSTEQIDEMQSRVDKMHSLSQLTNRRRSITPTNVECLILDNLRSKQVEGELQYLMSKLSSDPDLVKEIVSKHLNDLLAKLNHMQQQLEKVLDEVVTTCRPMTCGEKQELQRSIKELPKENLERVAKIIENHYVALGKGMPDEVVVNMEDEDIPVWRLHYCVAAIKSARKLDS